MEKKWLWKFKDYDFYYEDGQEIKFRVIESDFSKEYQQKIKASNQTIIMQ